MARLAGVDLPREKRMEIALTYIYGVGRTRAKRRWRRPASAPTRVHAPQRRRPGRAARLHRRAPTRSRVTCAARSPPTSAARSRSAATRASGTAGACRCTASAPRPTRAPARARRRPSPARRRQARSSEPRPRRSSTDHLRSKSRCRRGAASRRQEGPPQGEEERRSRPRPHQEHVQQHHRLDHRPAGHVITWASAGHVGFKGSRKSTPFAAQMAAETAARKARSTACARSTSSSRVRAPAARPRSARCRPPASRSAPSRTSPRCRTTAAARPSAAGSEPELQDEAWLVTPAPLQAVPPREDEAVPQGREVRLAEVPDRDPALPAGPARPRPHQGERVPAADAGEAEGQHSYGVLEKQFRRYYEEAIRRHGKTGDNLLQILESRLDNVVYRAGFARAATGPPAGQPRPLHGQRPARSTSRATGCREYDIIDVRPKSPELTPFLVARGGRRAAGPRPGFRSCPAGCGCSCTRCRSGRRSTPRFRSS